MSDKTKLISIVIPVKNGEPWLQDCLDAITKQTLFPQSEIIILDSGSTDSTMEILKNFPVRIFPIAPVEFNHGLTRNFGVEQANGEYVVMTVQDAKPTDDLWLQKLVDGFSAADNVAGVCGQQIVAHDKDKNPVDWFRPYSEPEMIIKRIDSIDTYELLSPQERKNSCGWDDVTAMYRKEVLLQIPFQKVSYGEDALWAQDALKKGYTLVYNFAARVYHYHQEDWDFTFKRTLTVMYLWYKNFGFLPAKPKTTFRGFLQMIKLIVIAKPLSLKEKWNWFLYNKERRRAMDEAYKTFFEALNVSEKKLDEVHEKFCGKPPMPLKPLNNSHSYKESA